MSTPTAEQVLPTRWVLHGIPSREMMAEHVKGLKRAYGIGFAKASIRQAIWVGCLPTNRGRKNRKW